MSTKTKVSKAQAEKVLAAVAKWLGEKRGMWQTATCSHTDACETNLPSEWPSHKDGSMCPKPSFSPAPTGPDAARNALGPELMMDWSWPSNGPTPTILLEGGPYDWAIEAAWAVRVPGVHTEPYAGYALCIYPD